MYQYAESFEYVLVSHNLYILSDYLQLNKMHILEFVITMAFTAIVIFLCLITGQLLRTSDFLAHYLFGAKLPPIAKQKPTQPELAIHPINKDQEEELETKVS